ncbi:hypothetical protein [Halovivax asiaticus]|nr:hypothetical protein [Halovivax asiaticus]
MSRQKLIAVTLTVAMLLSGIAAVGLAAPGAWTDQHQTDDSTDGTELTVTVENATVFVVPDESNVPMNGAGDMADNATDGNESGMDDNESDDTGVGTDDNESDTGMDDGANGTSAESVERLDEVHMEVTVASANIVDLGDTSMETDDSTGMAGDETNESETENGATGSDMADAGQNLTIGQATVFVVIDDDEWTGADGETSLSDSELDSASIFIAVGDETDDSMMGEDNGVGTDDNESDTDAGMDDNESDTGVGTDDNESDDTDTGMDNESETGMTDGGDVSINTSTIFVYTTGSLADLTEDAGAAATDGGTDVADNESDSGIGADDNETDAGVGMDDNESDIGVGVGDDNESDAGVGTDDNETDAGVGTDDNESDTGVGTDENETDAGMDDNESDTGVGTDENETDAGMDDNESDTGIGADDNESDAGVGTDDSEDDTTDEQTEADTTWTVERATIYVYAHEDMMGTGDDSGLGDE